LTYAGGTGHGQDDDLLDLHFEGRGSENVWWLMDATVDDLY